MPDDTPFLFTRNFGFGADCRPPHSGMMLTELSRVNEGDSLIKYKLAVIVTKGGSVFVVKPRYASEVIEKLHIPPLKILAP